MNGFRCAGCNWLGDEPTSHRITERDGVPPPYRVTLWLSCPSCNGSDLEDAHICDECEDELCEEGYDQGRQCLIESGEYEEGDFNKEAA